MSKPKIQVIVLGGTITMAPSASGGIVPTLTGKDMLEQVPILAQIADIEVETPFLVPGASLTVAHLGKVAERIGQLDATETSGVVVVQGTDTIDETSFLLDLLYGGALPVVVTGAMRGATAPGADGHANLAAAVTVAASPAARNLGTLVVLNDEVHAARFVEKGHTGFPSAFNSRNGGPLGLVAEGRFRLVTRPADRPELRFQPRIKDVAIVKAGLGDDGRLMSALSGLGFEGAVIEGMGAGHVPDTLVAPIQNLAGEMPVVLATRVPAGPIFTETYGFPGSEIDLIKRGVIPAEMLTPHKARLLLALCLGARFDRVAIAAAFEQFG